MAAATSETEEDVPPLEDMSHLLRDLPSLKEKEKRTEDLKSLHNPNPYLEAGGSSSEDIVANKIERLLGEGEDARKNAQANISEVKEPTIKSKKKCENNFGGFKKGFLLGNQDKAPQPKRTSSSGRKMEELKPKAKNETPLVIPEVQDALAAKNPLLESKDWITEEFLSKLQKNPKLFRQLQDPKFSKAFTEFQSNPKQAMAAFQTDPELREFFQEFCCIMGDHFTRLGEKNETVKKDKVEPLIKPASSKSTNPSVIQPVNHADEAKMQAILSDPEIRTILAKPKIQELIAAMRKSPGSAQRILSQFEHEEHKDIQSLIEAGLLGVSRS